MSCGTRSSGSFRSIVSDATGVGFGGATEPMSKRRRGFPSETRVKRGLVRTVGGDGSNQKVLEEKLGRSDPCPCGSGRRFQTLLSATGKLGRDAPRQLRPLRG